MTSKLLREEILREAVRRIETEDVPCVFVRDGIIMKNGTGTGVRPLIDAWEEEPELLRGTVIVDKIVGKAAAMLAVLGGAAGVCGLTMSAAARDYLSVHGIPAEYGTLTERIINRTGTGLCPMETAVLNIDDPEEGCAALKDTMARLAGRH